MNVLAAERLKMAPTFATFERRWSPPRHRPGNTTAVAARPTNGRRGRNATCPCCQGSGEADDGGECETCGGEGILIPCYEANAEEAYRNTATHHESLLRHRADNRSVSQMVRDHRAHMARLYDVRDRELSEAWRQS
jgi:hypothetical protein